MNIRKGLLRLLLVWLTVWALMGYWGWVVLDKAQRGEMAVLKGTEPFSSYSREMMTYHSANSDWGVKVVKAALLAGLVLPVCTAIVFVVGRWIYRGFKAAR